MARELEEFPQDVESMSETDAMLGMSAPRRCSRSAMMGFSMLALACAAILVALALPRQETSLKSHHKAIGLNEDDIWASVLSPDAMKQYKQEKALNEEAPDHQAPASPAPAPKAPAYSPPPAAPAAPAPARAAAPASHQDVQKSATDAAQELMDSLFKPAEDAAKKAADQAQAVAQKPMAAVQNMANQMKDSLSSATIAPLKMPTLPTAAPLTMPTLPTVAPAVMNTVNSVTGSVNSKADEMKKMADDFLKEAQSVGGAKKSQLESIASMLKKDAEKLGTSASGAVTGAVAAVAPAVPAVAGTKTVTENPMESKLAPKVAAGSNCMPDEEEFGGLCYKPCNTLTGGSHPCRSSAWSCCAVPTGPNCAAKASFGNCWLHMGFCGGYSVAGDSEAASGNNCPTGEGGCLENEEMSTGECLKKCSLLAPEYPFRMGPTTCCKKNSAFDCFWPTNYRSDPSFNVGGGANDGNSGTVATAHTPYTLTN